MRRVAGDVAIVRGEVVRRFDAVVMDGDQLVLHVLEFPQATHPRRRVAAVQPLEGDQLFLPADRVARFPDHQLQGGAQAGIVELVDQPVEIGTKLGPAQSIPMHQ